MKKVTCLLSLFLILCCVVTTRATRVHFSTKNMTGLVLNNRKITIIPVHPYLYNGSDIFVGDEIVLTTTNGVAECDLEANDYTWSIEDISKVWKMSVPDTNTVQNAGDLTPPFPTYTYDRPLISYYDALVATDAVLQAESVANAATIASVGQNAAIALNSLSNSVTASLAGKEPIGTAAATVAPWTNQVTEAAVAAAGGVLINDPRVVNAVTLTTTLTNNSFVLINTNSSFSVIGIDSPVTGIGHQGTTSDGINSYSFDSGAIYLLDENWKIKTINNTPFSTLPGVSHFGAGKYYSSKLYAVAENWVGCGNFSNQRIIIYNAADLSFIQAKDISINAHEVSSITVDYDAGVLLVSSYCDGSKIWKYSMTTLDLVGTITLSTTVNACQGIDYRDGLIYMMGAEATFPMGGIYTVSKNGAVTPLFGISAAAGVSANFEGIDVSQNDIRMNRDDTRQIYHFQLPNAVVSKLNYTNSLSNAVSATAEDIRRVKLYAPSLPISDINYKRVFYFPFDENVRNYAESGMNSCHNSGASFTEGQFGGAINIPIGKEVLVGSPSYITNITNITVAAWFNVTNAQGDLISRHAGGSQGSFALTMAAANQINFFVINTNAARVTVGGVTPYPLTDGKWHFAAGVYNCASSNLFIYVDGVIIQNIVQTGSIQDSSVPVVIGGYNAAPTFNGKLDDLQVWTRALSKAELDAVYGLSSVVTNYWTPTLNAFYLNGATYYTNTILGANYTYGLGIGQTAYNDSVDLPVPFHPTKLPFSLVTRWSLPAGDATNLIQVLSSQPNGFADNNFILTLVSAATNRFNYSQTNQLTLGGGFRDDGSPFSIRFRRMAGSVNPKDVFLMGVDVQR